MSTATEEVNYERLPEDMDMDETDISIRAYFSRMSDDTLREYDPTWSDVQLMDWDSNFRNDGTLMMVCCERDIDCNEYRDIIEEHIGFRKKYGGLTGTKV